MRIIAFGIIREFGEKHPHTMSALAAWYKIARSREVLWDRPQDVVHTFGASRVDILKNNRVCIDVAGNKVRIILKVEYEYGMAFVRWIGWHKDYDHLGDSIHHI